MDTRTHAVREGRPERGYSPADDNPARIKEEIDRTRADLDRTIDELSARLSPRRLTDDFMDMFTGRDGHPARGPGTRDLLRAVRDNPVPAALFGAGVAWFLFEQARPRQQLIGNESQREVGRYDGRDWLAPGAVYEAGEEAPSGGRFRERAQAAMESGRERLSEAGGTVRRWGTRAGESVSHAAHDAGKRVSHAADKVRSAEGPHLRERAEDMRYRAGELRHRANDAARSIRNTVEEHPLMLGAAALGIGLLAAIAAPPTRRERDVFGPARDELLDEARQYGRQHVAPQAQERAREVAERTGRAVAGEAFDQGTRGQERATRVAQAGIHAAGEAVREQLHREGEHPEPDQPREEPGGYTPGSPARRIEPDAI